MCELHVMIVDGTGKRTFMEDVVRIAVNEDEITATGMLGDTRTVRGKILHVDLTKQEALVAKIE